MSSIQNNTLLRTIWRQPVDKTPVWIMRQAGRYLPEYRAVRQKAGSFMQLCKTPELACEVTLQPVIRFPLDAAILFSDILTIPDAMGLGLYFKEGEGPAFERPLQSERAIHSLSVPDPTLSLRYVLDTIKMVQHELAGKIPLIGFCGSPWTIATYMVEGKANKLFPMIQKMRVESPALLHQLLNVLAQAVAVHLNAQIIAGVNAVMIFDTWGSLLDTDNYSLFSLNYIKQVITHLLKERDGQPIPIILFTKGGHPWLEIMANAHCHVLGIDWHIDMKTARQRVGHQVALQGNLNPGVLLEKPETIRSEVARVLQEFGEGPGHIFNLGHGITPDVPPENVAVLVDAVHELSVQYHQGR